MKTSSKRIVMVMVMYDGHGCFRLILIAEKNTVYAKFPTPLINRMEKHFVMTSSVLLDWQQEVLDNFQEWTRIFSVTGFVYL